MMKRNIAFVTFLLCCFTFFAAGDCPLTPDVNLSPGPHNVGVMVLWPHEDPASPGELYTFTAVGIFIGPGTPPLSYGGHPVRATWVIDGGVFVVDCPLFADSFETGTTSAWSVTHGGAK